MSNTGSQTTNRGFTGHEHLDEFGLINMNARLYDPLLGRFLAPDPIVQSPFFSQSYNRYTYTVEKYMPRDDFRPRIPKPDLKSCLFWFIAFIVFVALIIGISVISQFN